MKYSFKHNYATVFMAILCLTWPERQPLFADTKTITPLFPCTANLEEPYGVCSHITRTKRDYNIREQNLLKMQEAGITNVRSDFDYGTVVKNGKTQTPTIFDNVLASTDNANTTFLPILDFASYEYLRGNKEYSEIQSLNLNYVNYLTNRYKGRIPVWEFRNECDLFENNTTATKTDLGHRYAKALPDIADAIHTNDPQAKVMFTGVSDVDNPFIETVFADLGDNASNCFDIMNFHFYDKRKIYDKTNAHFDVPESIIPKLELLDTKMQKYNISKPVWLTETGCTTPGENYHDSLFFTEVVPKVLRRLNLEASQITLALVNDPGNHVTAEDFQEGYFAAFHDVCTIKLDNLASLSPEEYPVLVPCYDEYFPKDYRDALLQYVQKGGTIILSKGNPFYYDSYSNSKFISATDHSFEAKLHIKVLDPSSNEGKAAGAVLNPTGSPQKADGWDFSYTWTYSKDMYGSGNKDNNGIGEAEETSYLTDDNLKTGDTFVPILTAGDDSYTGTVAALYNLDSDLTGNIIVQTRQSMSFKCTEMRQAIRLPRAYLIAFSYGIDKVFWYNLRSLTEDATLALNERHYGILNQDLSNKQAYLSYQTLATTMCPSGSTRPTLEITDNQLYTARWQRPDGKYVAAIWSLGGYMLATPSTTDLEAFDYLGKAVTPQGEQYRITASPVYFISDESVSDFAFTTGSLPKVDEELTEGWYCLACDSVAGNYAKGNALTVQNGYMTVEHLDETNPAFFFYLKKADGADDNNFYLYNLGEDAWYQGAACLKTDKTVGYLKGYGKVLPGFYFEKDSTQRRYFTFQQFDKEYAHSIKTYKMYPQVQPNLTTLNKTTLTTPDDYSNFVLTFGGNVSNLIGTQYMKFRGLFLGAKYIPRLHVTFKKLLSDSELLNAAKLKVSLRKAGAVLNDNTIYTAGTNGLISNVGQLFSTTVNTEKDKTTAKNNTDPDADGTTGKLENLLSDNKVYRSYQGHGVSENNVNYTGKTYSPSYVQVDVSSDNKDNKQVKGVRLQMNIYKSDRYLSALSPTDISVFGSNADASLAESTTENTELSDILKSDSWIKIGDYNFEPFLTDKNDDYGSDYPKATVLNTDITTGTQVTKDIVFPNEKSYRFLRFYVNNTTVNYNTNHMFELDRLQLYELSEITATHGLLNDIKILKEQITTDNQKIQKGSDVSETDVTRLRTTIDNISTRRTVTISAVGYATFVSDVNVTLPEGLEAYIVTNQSSTEATLYKIGGEGYVLGKGVQVLLKGDTGTYILPVTESEAGSVSKTNLLKGTSTENQSNPDTTNPTYYTLQNNNGSPVFKKYTGATLKAGYAYLPVTSTSDSPAFLNLSFDAATGIQSAVNSENNKAEKTYDLEGRSVKHPQKGIYIRGGKKVIIK